MNMRAIDVSSRVDDVEEEGACADVDFEAGGTTNPFGHIASIHSPSYSRVALCSWVRCTAFFFFFKEAGL